MSQYLPLKEFEFIDDFDVNEILSTADDADYGYMLEVSIAYPKKLHDLHNNLAFLPEHISMNQKNNAKKLMLTLKDKDCYVLHYRTLKNALSHGLKLIKVHKVLKFFQSPFLKPYIDMNTIERQKATNDFDKQLFKNMNNYIFGKCLQSVRKMCNIKLISKWDGRYGCKNLIALPNFKNRKIFSENLVSIELAKTNLYYNKAIIIGSAILEISRTLIYKFYYDFMIPKLGNNVKLCYIDTDGLILQIQNTDIYQFIKENINEFDTSDYDLNNPYNIPLANKKIVGKMKDECNGTPISHFVGLRAKMYSIKIGNQNKIVKKAKGVKKNIINKKISFENYVDCLKKNLTLVDKQNLIKSHLHKVYSIEQEKKMLNGADDKRFILKDRISTLAWGHFRIENEKNNI